MAACSFYESSSFGNIIEGSETQGVNLPNSSCSHSSQIQISSVDEKIQRIRLAMVESNKNRVALDDKVYYYDKQNRIWEQDKKLGAGAFGSVYSVKLLTDPQVKKAVKIGYNGVESIREEVLFSLTFFISGNKEGLQQGHDWRIGDDFYLTHLYTGDLLNILNDIKDIKVLVRSCKQLMIGLKNLHGMGYVHKDIGRRNCLYELSDKGKLVDLVLSDFGRCKGFPLTTDDEIVDVFRLCAAVLSILIGTKENISPFNDKKERNDSVQKPL